MTCLTRLVILLLVIAYIGASNDESNHVDVDEKVSLGTKSKHEICERVSFWQLLEDDKLFRKAADERLDSDEGIRWTNIPNNRDFVDPEATAERIAGAFRDRFFFSLENHPEFKKRMLDLLDELYESFGGFRDPNLSESTVRFMVTRIITEVWTYFDDLKGEPGSLTLPYTRRFKLKERHFLTIDGRLYDGESDLSLHYTYRSNASLIPLVVKVTKPKEFDEGGHRQTILLTLSAAEEAEKVTAKKFRHLGIYTDGNRWLLVVYDNRMKDLKKFEKLSFHPMTKLDTKTFNDFQIHPETPKTLEEFQANAMEAIENLAKLHALVYQDYLRDQPIRL